MTEHVSPITLQSPNGFGTSDDAPQVIERQEAPEVDPNQFSHNAPEPTMHQNWALPVTAPAREPPESTYLNHGSTFGTTVSSQTPPSSEKRDASPKPKTHWWKKPASVPFIVLTILAILVVAGLAAGIGVVASQKNNKSSDSNSSSSSDSQSPPKNDYNDITMKCSDHQGQVNGTSYTSSIYNQGMDIEVPAVNFDIYCYGIANTGQLLSVFTPDFEGCMNACASWNAPVAASNGTACEFVTFIPQWTNYTQAKIDNSPGDCYLAPKVNLDKGIGMYAGVNASQDFERHVGIVVK